MTHGNKFLNLQVQDDGWAVVAHAEGRQWRLSTGKLLHAHSQEPHFC